MSNANDGSRLDLVFSLRTALKNGTLPLPEDFAAQAGEINAILKKLAGRFDIKNADDRKVIKTREAVLQSPEFKALWERIKHKTTYRVELFRLVSGPLDRA